MLLAAENVTILVINESAPAKERGLLGSDVAVHLRHHCISTSLHH